MMIEQRAEHLHMRVRAAHRGAQHRRLGRLAVEQPLDHLFLQQRRADLAVEFAVEPGDQPADFGPLRGAAGEQRVARLGFLEIFADGAAVRQPGAALWPAA